MRAPAGDDGATRQPRSITESPALLARERQVFARYRDSLVALIADETGAARDAVEPWVVANALLGVHRALIAPVRRRTLADAAPRRSPTR